MNIETIIGIVASVCTGASLVPQLVKVLKEKEAESVSLKMLAVLFLGLSLWVLYGVLKEDIIIIIANSFSFVVNVMLTIFAIKYKEKGIEG